MIYVIMNNFKANNLCQVNSFLLMEYFFRNKLFRTWFPIKRNVFCWNILKFPCAPLWILARLTGLFVPPWTQLKLLCPNQIIGSDNSSQVFKNNQIDFCHIFLSYKSCDIFCHKTHMTENYVIIQFRWILCPKNSLGPSNNTW